jgi:uncharacterized membrane protein YfcA
MTGFGFALLSFPLLLTWYSPKEIIPVLMICNLIASVMIVLQKKEYKMLDKQSYYLIGAGGLFTIAGVIALSSTSGEWLIRFSGILFIVLTIYSVAKKMPRKTTMGDGSYLSAGAFIGFLTGAVSVSGPPLALFLNKANISNRKFREIFAAFSVITAIIAIFGYYQAGMITLLTLKTSLIFVPILLTGTIVGKKLNTIVSVEKFQAINIVLTLIASIMMIVR